MSSFPVLLWLATSEVKMRVNDVVASGEAEDAGLEFAPGDAARCLIEASEATAEQPVTAFLCARVRSEAALRRLAARSVMVLAASELWCEASSFDELVTRVHELCEGERRDQLAAWVGTSFRFDFCTVGRRVPRDEQTPVLKRLGAVFPLVRTGVVLLKGAELSFSVTVEYDLRTQQFRRCFFSRHICHGMRDSLHLYSLKTRRYIGPTSMDVEMAMATANQALMRRGSLVLDPCVGTGSLLVSAAHYGAYCFGCDIDPRVLHGKDGLTIASNFSDYGFPQRLLGYASVDLPKSALRQVPMWDAIITDPPYGVRAGAKTIGMKARTAANPDYHVPDPTNHFPQFLPYSLRDSLRDLLAFAARTLVVGGRLVYWLPSTSEFQESDFPLHPCLELLCWSRQLMSGDTRRLLVTMRKTIAYDAALHANPDPALLGQLGEPAHVRFADTFHNNDQV